MILKYRKYAEALYRALLSDPFYITMGNSTGGHTSSMEAMLQYMDYSIIEAEKFGEIYIPGDHEYGVSVWAKPLAPELEYRKSSEKKSFLENELGIGSLNTYSTIVEYMSAQAEPLIGKDCWYLSIVGVLPEFQGQGLGPGLIKNVLKKTDRLKVSTYLETYTPRNITFYNRLGYQVIDSFTEPTTSAEYWLMIREPLHA